MAGVGLHSVFSILRDTANGSHRSLHWAPTSNSWASNFLFQEVDKILFFFHIMYGFYWTDMGKK